MGRPRKENRRGRTGRRWPERKFVVFVTGLMAWTVYCSFIAVYPDRGAVFEAVEIKHGQVITTGTGKFW